MIPTVNHNLMRLQALHLFKVSIEINKIMYQLKLRRTDVDSWEHEEAKNDLRDCAASMTYIVEEIEKLS